MKIKGYWDSRIRKGILFIIMLLMVLPQTDKTVGSNATVIRLIQVFQLCMIGYVALKRGLHPNPYIAALLIFELEFMISAVYNRTEVLPFAIMALPVVSLVLFSDYQMRKNPREFLVGAIAAMELYGTIHLLMVLGGKPLYIESHMGEVFFLGSDNQATSFYLCLTILCVIESFMYGINLLTIYGIAISVFTAFYSECGTAMMVYLIVVITYILGRIPYFRRILYKITNYRTFIVLYIIYSVFVFLAPIIMRTGPIANIVYSVTGKTMDFTERSEIWRIALALIQGNPVFGIGYGEGGNGIYYKGWYFGAHNQVLQWAVYGGILSVALFLLVLCLSVKRTEKIRSLPRYFILFTLFGYLVAMSMEICSHGLHLFFLLNVIYNIPGCPDERSRRILHAAKGRQKDSEGNKHEFLEDFGHYRML